MSEPAEILVARIDRRLAEIGKSRWWLSMEVTNHKRHGVITDIARKGHVPAETRLRAMADLLGTTTDYLLGRSENAGQPVSEVSFTDVRQEWRGPVGDGIKLVGTAYCEDLKVDSEGEEVSIERVQLDIDHVVRLIQRPAALWNAHEAYAIYMHGSSMEPRFFQGETAIVDPQRPAGPGDYVLVQLNDGLSDDVMTVLVKRLARISAAFVEFEQHNPPMHFRLPRKQVARMHRIYRPDELLG